MHKNYKLIAETLIVFLLNGLLAIVLFECITNDLLKWLLYIPLLIFQGLWYYRLYIIGHECAHKKLIPENNTVNDVVGSIALIPLLVPINIYRKIHYFHHGFNRKDPHTSALDTFVITGKFKKLKTVYYYFVWYISVFFGGFFLHSLISVMLFLFVPSKLSSKISPAFKGWQMKDQFIAILLFCIGLLFHYVTFHLLGKQYYLLVLGFPMLSFAWVLSLLVYIFHYDTTIGEEVRYNVRSVRPVPVISWILMNFNEHATHHQHPNIPWYELPSKRKQLPDVYAIKNQQTTNFFVAIFRQLKGPSIHYEN